MYTYILVYPCNRILISNKKGQVLDTCVHESQKHYAVQKKSDRKHNFFLILFLPNSQKGTAIVRKSRAMVAWGRGGERVGTDYKRA